MAIITTPAGTTSNSYATWAEMDAYMENHPDLGTWEDSAMQEEALLWATIRLDEYDFVGQPATETQSLKWPRIDDDIFELKWTATEIPLRLKYAQFELALDRLRDAESGTSSSDQTVSSLKIGSSVEVKYDTGASGSSVDTSVDFSQLPIQAARFLKGLRIPAVLA